MARLCSDLVRYPTENPPPSATNITRFIKEWLKEAGVRARIYCKEKGKENLVSNLSRSAGADGLVLYGHSDVVPAGDRKRWTFPPYSGRLTQGKIHGRGASDMKGGLAAILVAYRTVAQVDCELKRNLLLTVIPDEENFDPSTKMLYKMIDDKIIRAKDPTDFAKAYFKTAVEYCT